MKPSVCPHQFFFLSCHDKFGYFFFKGFFVFVVVVQLVVIGLLATKNYLIVIVKKQLGEILFGNAQSTKNKAL